MMDNKVLQNSGGASESYRILPSGKKVKVVDGEVEDVVNLNFRVTIEDAK